MNTIKNKWYLFDKSKGSYQKRPPIKKNVLVLLPPKDKYSSYSIAVGYRKNAAGDKQCPYFVIPGIGGEVLAWCDCLPSELFDYKIIENILTGNSPPDRNPDYLTPQPPE